MASLGNHMAALLSANEGSLLVRGMWAEAPSRLRGLAENTNSSEAWTKVRCHWALNLLNIYSPMAVCMG